MPTEHHEDSSPGRRRRAEKRQLPRLARRGGPTPAFFGETLRLCVTRDLRTRISVGRRSRFDSIPRLGSNMINLEICNSPLTGLRRVSDFLAQCSQQRLRYRRLGFSNALGQGRSKISWWQISAVARAAGCDRQIRLTGANHGATLSPSACGLAFPLEACCRLPACFAWRSAISLPMYRYPSTAANVHCDLSAIRGALASSKCASRLRLLPTSLTVQPQSNMGVLVSILAWLMPPRATEVHTATKPAMVAVTTAGDRPQTMSLSEVVRLLCPSVYRTFEPPWWLRRYVVPA